MTLSHCHCRYLIQEGPGYSPPPLTIRLPAVLLPASPLSPRTPPRHVRHSRLLYTPRSAGSPWRRRTHRLQPIANGPRTTESCMAYSYRHCQSTLLPLCTMRTAAMGWEGSLLPAACPEWRRRMLLLLDLTGGLHCCIQPLQTLRGNPKRPWAAPALDMRSLGLATVRYLRTSFDAQSTPTTSPLTSAVCKADTSTRRTK